MGTTTHFETSQYFEARVIRCTAWHMADRLEAVALDLARRMEEITKGEASIRWLDQEAHITLDHEDEDILDYYTEEYCAALNEWAKQHRVNIFD